MDAQLADSLSAGRATAKAVIDRLVKSGPMGRGTPCCSLSETSEMKEVTPELKERFKVGGRGPGGNAGGLVEARTCSTLGWAWSNGRELALDPGGSQEIKAWKRRAVPLSVTPNPRAGWEVGRVCRLAESSGVSDEEAMSGWPVEVREENGQLGDS